MSAPTFTPGREINLLDSLPQTKRDPKARAAAKTAADRALAKQFGGGGHARASGALVSGSLTDVHAKVLAAARLMSH